MSKLYTKTSTDAIKGMRTARGHHEAVAAVLYNWHGGNSPDGSIITDVAHNGEQVVCTVTVYNGQTAVKQWSHTVTRGEHDE